MKYYIYHQKSNIFWTAHGWFSVLDAQVFDSFEEALSIKNEYLGEKAELIKIISDDDLLIVRIIE